MSETRGNSATPPLVRHEALRPLSRDHYQGLVQSQHLMSIGQSMATHPYTLLEEFLDRWNGEIAVHFDDEERLLPPLITCKSDRERLFGEHATLRAMVAELADGLGRGAYDPAAVQRLGRLLHDHIRWEERVVFEAIQASASPVQLEELAQSTVRIEQSRDRRSCRAR